MKQLIIFVIVAFHQNSYVLNWFQIITSIELLKCYQNLATLLRAQAVKQFACRLLFGKSKSCMKAYVAFKLENICRQNFKYGENL